MSNLEIFGDTLLYWELYIGYLNIFALVFWLLFKKFPIKLIFLLSSVSIVLLGSFRPADYNSDSANYLSYVLSLSSFDGADIYFVSKIEPLHVLLISIFRDYRLWLISEAIITIICLIVLYRRTKNSLSFLLPTAFVLTLNTSSLRFSLACILLSALLTTRSSKWYHYVLMTIVSTAAHGVMATSGAFATRIKIVPIAFAAVFIIAATYFSFIGERVNIDYSELKSIGLKSFSVFIIMSFYCFYRIENYKKEQFFFDIIGFTTIFALTAALFPTLNRIIIIGTIVVLLKTYGYDKVFENNETILDRAFVVVLVSLIVAPYLYAIPALYFTSTW